MRFATDIGKLTSTWHDPLDGKSIEVKAIESMRRSMDRLRNFFHLCWKRISDHRSRRRAIQELRALDDRLLRDIGIERDQIESVVYSRPRNAGR